MGTVYHVTTLGGKHGILTTRCVDPDKATGSTKRSWFVPRHLVSWALLHVARRHGKQLGELAILEIPVGTRQFFSHAGSGLLYRKCRTQLTGGEDWTRWEDWCRYDDAESQKLAAEEASEMYGR